MPAKITDNLELKIPVEDENLAKMNKKESTTIDDPQRCEICSTILTLYPKDFAPCPHCHRKVCRQCWGAVWATKAFTEENCSHIKENDGRMAPVGVSEGRKAFNLDWPRAVVVLVIAAVAAGVLFLLYNLFA